jgi:hypothetical protein
MFVAAAKDKEGTASAGQDREGPNIRCSGLETARFDVKIQVLMTCKIG